MTSKEKIIALNESLRAMAMIGKIEQEPGTIAEEELLLRLAVLGCAMGKLFLQYAETQARAEAETSVAE